MSIKNIALVLIAAAALLLAVLLVRTFGFAAPPAAGAAVEAQTLDEAALAQGLAQALQIATISVGADPERHADALLQFRQLLERRFPKVHSQLRVETVAKHSLLFTWQGADPELKPALLAAHMDVVPIEPGTQVQWTHPPFAGVIADGYIWGRGALDNKSGLMGLLEACEHLLAQGHKPLRTLYLAFGHDEEIGGPQGAAQIAALLQERGVHLAFTLDEGSALMQGIIAGIKPQVAAIMAGEKGYATFRLSLQGAGGHSSMPGRDTVLPRLARAVARLDAQPLPARLTPLVGAMLERLAPEMPFVARLMIANRWLFEPLLLRALASKPITDAMTRTTQAVTVMHGGVKDNVLPSEAYALVNYRLLPGDTLDGVRQHIVEALKDAAIAVQLSDEFGTEAPPPSDPRASEFAIIARSVAQVFPQALISTGLVMATTDNRHYAGVRDQGYYFAPFVYTPDDQTRLHGSDERIRVSDYANMVRFYIQLMLNSSAAG